MSLKLFSKAALAGVAIMAATSASAAIFDFVSMADGPNVNYIGPTELNWGDTAFSGGLTIDDIKLDASGSNANQTFADAFFDKGNAGLGVCSTVGPGPGLSGCATGIGSATGDDNVNGTAGGETLTLDFNQTVSIASIFFNDDGHVPLSGVINLVGTGLLTITNGLIDGGVGLLGAASVYNFEYVRGNQFYLANIEVSAVPIPAAGLLLLGALGGLGAVGRRRRRS